MLSIVSNAMKQAHCTTFQHIAQQLITTVPKQLAITEVTPQSPMHALNCCSLPETENYTAKFVTIEQTHTIPLTQSREQDKGNICTL